MDILFVFLLITFCVFIFFSISKGNDWKALVTLFKKQSDKKVDLKLAAFGYKQHNDSKMFYSSLVKIGANEELIVISHVWPLKHIFCDLEVPVKDLDYVGEERLALRKFLKLKLRETPDSYLYIPKIFERYFITQ